MSSPFGDNRPNGNGADDDPTTQWHPLDGDVWPNSPGAYDDNPWSAAPTDNPFADGAAGGAGGAGGYAAGSGGYPGGPGGYPGGPGGYPGGPGGYPGGDQQPQKRGGNGGLIAAIGVVVVLLIIAGGALGYFLTSGGDEGAEPSAEPLTDSRSTAAPAEQTTATSTSRPRAEGWTAPGDWTKCGGSGDPGDLNLYYAGTSVTSCPFTKAVRDALVEHYLDTGELDGAIKAYSPVTRQSYDMNCSDDGDVVTCRGGDNAVVHVV
ncbi:hypothetical protein [Corynebacterium freneyi]|uniref:Serine/threonine-protein kinase n=1 Tax=Corynebacterium freneyi TaxID=134034 RepID=A0ABS4UB98_9CORY|nr:hypothetical protein [Corynebacterium freneyi]MBP2333793.1 serine/threonine-protein kinase [Corynebacterium freneyi]QXA52222.1 hypothetical protein I6L56_08975 [Corynebacterium freneyi]WJZ04104.1 hypothetical protein CFREN_00520 [Corynebacterium freneyi]